LTGQEDVGTVTNKRPASIQVSSKAAEILRGEDMVVWKTTFFVFALIGITGSCAAQQTTPVTNTEIPAQRHGFKLNFVPSEVFRGTRIYRQADNLAYAYEVEHAAADADGAPNAYHPDDLHKNCIRDPHVGLDCPENAGYPRASWWKQVLVPDPAQPSNAFVQPSGPFKGFFVAMTSLRKPNGNKFDPSTYVDATQFPYVVIPSGFGALPHVAKQGDVGVATHLDSGRSTTFIVADEGGGSDAKLGEASIALYAALGFPHANPRTGSGLPSGKIQYIIFPASHRKGAALWPRTNDDIRDQAMYLVSHTPGIE
jgi:hypothetical protein